MNKKIPAAAILALLLILCIVLIAGGCRRSEQDQINVQQSEPEYSLVIQDAGKPATRAVGELPVLTTDAEPLTTAPETTLPRTETTVTETESVTTKPRKTKPVTTEPEYLIETEALTETDPLEVDVTIDKDGIYTTKDDVALYIYTYGELPSNFISKKEAQKLGWEGGSLEPYAPNCCIGGSRFGNYEGILPEKPGREYTECDIDTLGKKSRGAKRIVFSNDGLIYYTDDHYKTFELLYGEE